MPRDLLPAGRKPVAEPVRVTTEADRAAANLRYASAFIVCVTIGICALVTIALHVRVDPSGTGELSLLFATLLLASCLLCRISGGSRIADALGTMAQLWIGGLAGGALAVLGLRLHMPTTDVQLHAIDIAFGFDGIAIVNALVSEGQWIFSLMAPAYAYTIPLVLLGTLILGLSGQRTEAWRACLCYNGSLVTIALIAMLIPAKGLGLWVPAALLAHLPDRAMIYFWESFDSFYSGADPVLSLDALDGVISFPSFHAAMGAIVVGIWRHSLFTLIPALAWFGLMLLATFPYGGHYAVDLAGGIAVWGAWFAFSKRLETWPVRSASLTDHDGSQSTI